MMFSTVVVISFHSTFITKVDRAYNIQCFYGETVQTVTVALDVSQLVSTEVAKHSPLPACAYSIRQNAPDGQLVQYANVGDHVVHRWECDSRKSHG